MEGRRRVPNVAGVLRLLDDVNGREQLPHDAGSLGLVPHGGGVEPGQQRLAAFALRCELSVCGAVQLARQHFALLAASIAAARISHASAQSLH